jgi:hypothetical protein
LIWLVVLIGPLLVLQRFLHREIQAVFLILTRSPQIAMTLFSLLFFPGVFLHEASHYIMAVLLRVRVGKVSLIPQVITAPDPSGGAKNSRLQLGYVETAKTDFLRDSLIGAAPLITGSLFVIFASLNRLHLGGAWNSLIATDFSAFWPQLTAVTQTADFWLWFYLVFSVSSTMLPSASDRRGWWTLAAVFIVLLALALLSGAGPWMLAQLAPAFNQGMRALAGVFAVTAVVHAILTIPVWLLEKLFSKLTGLQVA